MSKTLQIILGIAALIVAIAVAYYFIVVLPNNSSKQLDFEKQKQSQLESDKAKQRQLDCEKIAENQKSSTGNPYLDAYTKSGGACTSN